MALGPVTGGSGGNNLFHFVQGTADPYTLMLWQYFNALTNGTGIFYRGGDNEAYLYDSGGVKIFWDGPDVYSSTVFSTSTWYHLAFTRTASSTELFVNGVSDVTGGAPGTASEFTLGYRRNSDSRRSALKFWGALLSDEEILQEMYFHVPIRTAGLERWHHFTSPGSTFKDYSGSGVADFTVYGTPTQGNPGPPITWRKGASRIFVPAGAAPPVTGRAKFLPLLGVA